MGSPPLVIRPRTLAPGGSRVSSAMLKIEPWLSGATSRARLPGRADANFVYLIGDTGTRRRGSWTRWTRGLLRRVEDAGFKLAGVLLTHWHPTTPRRPLRPAVEARRGCTSAPACGLRPPRRGALARALGRPAEPDVTFFDSDQVLELDAVRARCCTRPATPALDLLPVWEEGAPPDTRALDQRRRALRRRLRARGSAGRDPREMFRSLHERLARCPTTPSSIRVTTTASGRPARWRGAAVQPYLNFASLENWLREMGEGPRAPHDAACASLGTPASPPPPAARASRGSASLSARSPPPPDGSCATGRRIDRQHLGPQHKVGRLGAGLRGVLHEDLERAIRCRRGCGSAAPCRSGMTFTASTTSRPGGRLRRQVVAQSPSTSTASPSITGERPLDGRRGADGVRQRLAKDHRRAVRSSVATTPAAGADPRCARRQGLGQERSISPEWKKPRRGMPSMRSERQRRRRRRPGRWPSARRR